MCDIDNNFSPVCKQKFHVGWPFNQDDMKRIWKFWGQLAIFIQKAKILQKNELALVINMIHSRFVEVCFLFVSGLEIGLHRKLTSMLKWSEEVIIVTR